MLTLKDFEHFMTDIVNHIMLSDKINELCRQYSTDGYVSYPSLDCDVAALLEVLMDDKGGWISYWLYELNCGDRYYDGCVTDKDGHNIPLKTIQDLYKMLTEKVEK